MNPKRTTNSKSKATRLAAKEGSDTQSEAFFVPIYLHHIKCDSLISGGPEFKSAGESTPLSQVESHLTFDLRPPQVVRDAGERFELARHRDLGRIEELLC